MPWDTKSGTLNVLPIYFQKGPWLGLTQSVSVFLTRQGRLL